MNTQTRKFIIGFFLSAAFAGVLPIHSQTPVESYQETIEKKCGAQKISENRTYQFRKVPVPTGNKGAYGKKPWYSALQKLIPFLETQTDNYSIDDVRLLADEYGKPAPVNESKRSKQIRSSAEQKLREAQQQGEQNWQEWLKLNPDAGIEAKNQAEVRLRFQGLAAANLKKFDWRDYGLDFGEVGFQGWECNSCWAFASIDAMQISRQLAAIRSQKNDFDKDLRPNVRQLISCMIPNADNYCLDNWHGDVFTFLVDKGLPLGGAKKYGPEKFDWKCEPEKYVKALTWDYVSVKPTEIAPTEDLKRAIIIYGAVASVIKLDDCLALYGSGVFNEEQKYGGRHFVLIVGWDDEKEAWLIKNSYGTDWGENGFGWIKYGSNRIGEAAAWIVPDPKEEERISKELLQEEK